MKILITGATGLVGKELGKALAERGHELFVVSRNVAKAQESIPFPCELIEGDLSKGPADDPRLRNIHAVVNLMGEPVVSGRWTRAKKKKIYDSRINGTKNLVSSVPKNLKSFISTSAIGFYGNRKDEILTEYETSGEDFLAHVCRDWEREANKAPGRKVILRTGIVLSLAGGSIDKMLFPFRAGVGGVIGRGEQWMSWIHIKDLVSLFIYSLENDSVEGVLNATAPQPVTNKTFSESLAKALGVKLGPSTPAAALKIIYGQAASVILGSIRASSERAETLGFKFQFSEIFEAMKDVCAPIREGNDYFYAEQYIPLPPEEIFSFFQDPYNLERITPPTLRFSVKKVSTSEIQQGTLIDYKLKIHGVPAQWRTEIDEWSPPFKFVDQQLKGPYSLWHHTHEFKPFCGGTLMTDTVRYRLPLGKLGWAIAGALVKSDVENIFSFRRQFISKGQLFAEKK